VIGRCSRPLSLSLIGSGALRDRVAGRSGQVRPTCTDACPGTISAVSKLQDGEAPAEADGFSAAVAAITSAFGDATRRGIYLFTRDRDSVTASEVAQRFELHPNVARHHLDKLAAGGYLEVFVDHEGGGVGRPSKRYRAVAGAAAVVPAHRDDLLVLLLARLLPLVDPEAAEQVAYEVGAEYGRTLGAQMAPGEAPRSVRAAMQAVADALTAHGFAARAGESMESMAVVLGNCPFGTAAIEHPVLCAADRGLVEGLVSVLCRCGVPVQLSSRARGDDVCATFTA
jgi:predicted ArsR family transcriptional regulator